MRSSLIFALFCAALLSACDRGDDTVAFELTGSTMGTTFSVVLVLQAGQQPEVDLQERIEHLVRSIEQSMSTYLLESEVSRFNASLSTEWFPVSPMLCGAVEESLAISKLTDGAFDITVGPLVNLWGFGPDNVPLEPPDDALIDAARERVGYVKLQADCSQPGLQKSRPDVYIDLSAYAKGFAVDRLAALLDDERIDNFMVEIGGELRTRGHNDDGDKWRVAIESPAGTAQRVLHLSGEAMATSGDYRNYYEFSGSRYSHTIDPRRARPVSHNLAAVSVVSESAGFADAMATALLVLGPEEGMRLATQQHVAAFFQLRTDNGFEQLMTPVFRDIASAE
ncbi:MAG TPA: FAD:protein FMN transferase [Woeseiaceae bacterium]